MMQRRLSGSPTTILPVTVPCGSPTNGTSNHNSFHQPELSSGSGLHHRQCPSTHAHHDTSAFARRHSTGSSCSPSFTSRAGKVNCGSAGPNWSAKISLALLMAIMFIAGGKLDRQQMKQVVANVEEARNKLEANERRLLHELSVAHHNAATESSEEAKLSDAIVSLRNEKHDLQMLLEEQMQISKKEYEEGNNLLYEKLKKDATNEIRGLTAGIQRMSKNQAIEQ